ncbi:hypothetical protein [Novosphingobium rosa]|uniref:hypothetical protein n=1 Tax=Novosphingobium rosa TaxID=76978 RepID=UPI00083778D9|nr:hypothetical protein [Novosphingobium rosa]
MSYHHTSLAMDDNRFQNEGRHHAKRAELLAEENFFAGAAARSELTQAAYRACIAGSSFGRHWAWEILLTVFAAGCAGETMSLSGAIGRLGAPYEFARRLVGVMVSEGSIRMSDEHLEDETSLSVTEHVFGALRSYLRDPARQAFAA